MLRTDKIFITEDLTKTRQFIVKELNAQKRENKIHSQKRRQTVESVYQVCPGY
jgi:hypothetical protein